MRRLTITPILGLIIAILALNATALTLIPGGSVSGTWTSAGSPYQIQGNITIPADSLLTIEPAVDVIFQGNYCLVINGALHALGSASDSIHFAGVGFWKGIRFIGAQDGCRLEYCTVQGVVFQGAIKCDQSNPVIAHSRISNNVGSSGNVAGGILMVNSAPEISYCDVSGNIAYGDGGAINCTGGSAATISHCTISENVAQANGGGIYVAGNSNAAVDHCTLSGNYAGGNGGGLAYEGDSLVLSSSLITDNDANFGGGLWLSAAVASISDATIHDNRAQGEGGGIWLSSSNAVIAYSAITENSASGFMGTPVESGGAIYAADCPSLTVDRCTVLYNSCNSPDDAGGIQVVGNSALFLTNTIMKGAGNWGFGVLIRFDLASSDNAQVTYDDIFAYPGAQAFSGNVPAGLGLSTQLNANGDPCDSYFNISLDPRFVDPLGDWHLLSASPCIDAGDPSSPPDPDNTMADLGRFFYDQRIPVIELSALTLDFGETLIGQQTSLLLTIYNSGGDTLELYNISCQNPVFSTDWTAAQNRILPGDSLSIIVSFLPDDTLAYSAALTIENNSELSVVQLSGRGIMAAGLGDDSDGGLPLNFGLLGVYPNPFNPSTAISFQLPAGSHVSLEVYDTAGRLVADLVNGWREAGSHEITFDGSNLPSGIYLYRLSAGEYQAVGKMMLMK